MAAPQTFDLADIKRRMQAAVGSFKHDLQSLRTGRANPNLLDPIQVEAYGAMMPLNQVRPSAFRSRARSACRSGTAPW